MIYTVYEMSDGRPVVHRGDALALHPAAATHREQLVRQYGSERALADANTLNLSETHPGHTYGLYASGKLVMTAKGGLGQEVR